MTNEDRLLAALEYQRAMPPAFGNPNLMRQGQRMNLPARQVPGPVSEFGTQAVSFDQQPDQGYGTMAAEMALGFVPGVGQAMAVRDIERARRDDDPLGMALAGLSLVPFGKMIGAMRGGKQVGPVSQLDVYHGSPHKFDKFDASKIGTGEGAQAYGHGLYFAEAPGVAKGYQIQNAYKTFDIGEEATKRGIPLTAAGRGEFSRQANANTDPVKAAKALQNANVASRSIPEDDLQKMFADYQGRGGGVFYKVDLPDAQIAKMLDWDKPLSQQPQLKGPLNKFAAEYGLVPPSPSMTGKQYYQALEDYTANTSAGGVKRNVSEDVSGLLRQYGIPGIRYLDQVSRAGGKGTSNFVVFPGSESMLTILERNNQNVGNMMKPTVPAPSLMYKDPFGATY